MFRPVPDNLRDSVLADKSFILLVLPFITIVEVAQILLQNRINSVPVVDEDEGLIGIITESDILKVLISFVGSKMRGIDFGFRIQDYPGSIKEITDVIWQHDGRIASILVSYEKAPAGYRNVYIRVYQIDHHNFENLKEALFADTKVLYALDYLEKTRKIFEL